MYKQSYQIDTTHPHPLETYKLKFLLYAYEAIQSVVRISAILICYLYIKLSKLLKTENQCTAICHTGTV